MALVSTSIKLCAVATLATAIGGWAQETTKEERSVSGFNEVVVHAIGDLIVRQGDRESLTIEAEAALLPKITTEVKGTTLHFSFNQPVIQTRYPLRYFLTVKSLNAVQLRGSGTLGASGLKTDSLKIIAGGSGKVAIDALAANTLTVKLTGSSNVTMSGAVDTQHVAITGSGDYQAAQLASQKTSAVIKGSGNIEVAVKDELSATIKGAGAIKYHGNPKVEQSITGAGRVTRL